MELCEKLSKRQNEIIHAAILIIAEHGMAGFTTKSLAEAVGVSEPALYRHFKNKSEIIQALLMHIDSNWDILQESRSGWELLKAFFAGRVEQVIANPALAHIIFAEELFIHDKEYAELMKTLLHKHRALIMENLVLAMSNNEIRNDIAPEVVFRMTAGNAAAGQWRRRRLVGAIFMLSRYFATVRRATSRPCSDNF